MPQKNEKRGISKSDHNVEEVRDILRGYGDKYYLFQTLINNIPDYIYIKDGKNRFIMVNKAMAELFGKKPKDFIGKTDFDIATKETAKESFKDDTNVIKGGKPVIDKTEKVVHLGKESFVSSSKIPWYDKSGKIIGTMGISRDITKRKDDIDRIIDKERDLINALMNNIPDTIYFKDIRSRFIRINKACAKKFGFKDPKEVIGKTDFNIFSKEHAQQAYDDEQKIIATGKPMVDIEEKETFKNKADKWRSTTKMPLYNEKGELIGTFGISKDITEKKKAEDKIRYLSFHDTLTGLYNRAYFEEELKRLDTERQLPLTIVMGDVNGLKLMNDAYGHDKGDILLKKISAILQDSFRKEDIVSRWGGDEFIAILPKTYTKDTENIIKRIREKCKKGSTPDMPLSISLGVSTKRSPAEDIEKILKEAEDKMYKNKISEGEETHEALINSFKKKLRKRDLRNEKLVNKIQDYAVTIGERLNLSKLKLEELRLLMNLHNIGKLALADEILSKPGSLNKEEWKIVKKLPEVGYRIAESSEQLKPIAEAILSHHEWYNGKGYPRGIKGDDIPILSRISFLVNSFEAMTRDRPYRKRMTYDEAINEIKKYSGVQFDPKVVNIFLNLVEKEKGKTKKS